MRAVLPTCLLMTAVVIAQAPQPANPAKPATGTDASTDTPHAYRAKNLLGMSVQARGEQTVGTVDDIILSDDGRVDYLIVSKNGKLVTVPWEAAKFNFDKKTTTIPLTTEQYQAIPTYTTDQYPSYYTPTYRQQVYKWYDMTPNQWRRVDRGIRR